MGEPGMPPPPPPTAPSASVAEQVNGPAVGLLVTAGVGALFSLTRIAMMVFGFSFSALSSGTDQDRIATMFFGTIGIATAVIGLIIAGVIFVGARRMQQLRSWGFGLTVSILAMIPCVSPCCLLGLPIGIWAIVVLVRPEVKAAFTA
jgi:predicted lysophospholipase L1 biosynthesis ABC-type transport system permease subunit